jgi:hypothetical protein
MGSPSLAIGDDGDHGGFVSEFSGVDLAERFGAQIAVSGWRSKRDVQRG